MFFHKALQIIQVNYKFQNGNPHLCLYYFRRMIMMLIQVLKKIAMQLSAEGDVNDFLCSFSDEEEPESKKPKT